MTDASKLEFSPEVFDPKKAELQAIAAEVASITADPEKMTKEDFELINTTKNKLVKARTTIEKAGKALRESANKFNKDVIAYEDELIGIIEPEEKRLKDIETAAKEYAMREERKKTLPEFIAKLDSIGDDIPVSEAELLALDPNERDAYYNGRLGAKLEADKIAADARRAEEDAAHAAEQKKLDDEREKIEIEKKAAKDAKISARVQRILTLGYREIQEGYIYLDTPIMEYGVLEVGDDEFEDVIKQARGYVAEADTKKKAIDDAAHEAEIKAAAEKATKEAEERAQAKADEEKAAAERRAEEEKRDAEKRSRAAKYEAFLKDNSYDAETDITTFENGITTLYRKVATYSHKGIE